MFLLEFVWLYYSPSQTQMILWIETKQYSIHLILSKFAWFSVNFYFIFHIHCWSLFVYPLFWLLVNHWGLPFCFQSISTGVIIRCWMNGCLCRHIVSNDLGKVKSKNLLKKISLDMIPKTHCVLEPQGQMARWNHWIRHTSYWL